MGFAVIPKAALTGAVVMVLASAGNAQSVDPIQETIDAAKRNQATSQMIQETVDAAKRSQATATTGIDIDTVQKRAAESWRSNQIKSVAGVAIPSPSTVDRQSRAATTDITGQRMTVAPQDEMMILISTSLNATELHQIVEDARKVPNTALVLRGFPNNDTRRGPTEIMELLGNPKDVPVIIDPRAFRENHIETVPALILKRGDKVSLVRGITNPRFLLERDLDDYGKQGPTADIAEPDIEQEIKARINSIDWAAKQRRGVERFWVNANILELPKLNVAQTRTVNMAVQAIADIRDGSGNIIVRKGTVIDPMKMIPFNTRLLIFDPNDPKQVQWAKAHASTEKTTMYLVVNYKREGAWDGWRALIDKMKAPIYLLTSNVRDRFFITGVPSLVESRAGQMTVQEGYDDVR